MAQQQQIVIVAAKRTAMGGFIGWIGGGFGH